MTWGQVPNADVGVEVDVHRFNQGGPAPRDRERPFGKASLRFDRESRHIVYQVVEPETLLGPGPGRLGPGPGRGRDFKAELEWTPNLKEYELRTWLSGLPDGDVPIDGRSVADRLVDAFKTRASTVFRTPDGCDLCDQDPVGWAHHPAADRPISEEPIGLCQEHLNSENWSEELGWCSIHQKWGRLGAKCPLGPHQFEVVPPPAQA